MFTCAAAVALMGRCQCVNCGGPANTQRLLLSRDLGQCAAQPETNTSWLNENGHKKQPTEGIKWFINQYGFIPETRVGIDPVISEHWCTKREIFNWFIFYTVFHSISVIYTELTNIHLQP